MGILSVPRVADVLPGEGFFKRIYDLVRDTVIPYQWEILNDRVPGATKSHCVENYRIAAGEADGEFQGFVFQDSDLAKWLEAAAYSLAARRDPELEAILDDMIALVGRAQQPDGYLNTYFIAKEPDKKWTNLRNWHELYCAGHMMEAAVAYFEATGKRELLDIMTRVARHIDTVLGPEEGKLHGYPGHEEIELALIRMYRVTNDPLMMKLARYFIDERGKSPNFFREEDERRKDHKFFLPDKFKDQYYQSHLPVREQTALEGHSVRALYMAAGMADVARETDDASLLAACRALFDNLVNHRMYVTGGVGSTHHGEAFSFDDDLPNDTVYAETCASIALCFFARAMLRIDPDAKYAEAMERALYNTCLAGMSLDGRNFFYVNPLEVWPEASEKDPGKQHVLPVRPKWFGCACCPPNLARLALSIGTYAYGYDENDVYVHQFVPGEAKLGDVTLRLQTGYPYDGNLRFTVSGGAYDMHIRVPAFAREGVALSVNGDAAKVEIVKGYAVLRRTWAEGDVIEMSFPMTPRRVYADPRVREDIGRVCVMRGPLVYCLEEADNGALLPALLLPEGAVLSETPSDELAGIVRIDAEGLRIVADAAAPLYTENRPRTESARLRFIPYYAWANRGVGEMCVWVKEK